MNATNWQDRHRAALASPRTSFERLSVILDAVEAYCRAYRSAYESDIADDAILGDEGVAPILLGVVRLLDGDLGRLDAGTMWGRADAIAKVAGWRDLDHMREDAAGV